MPIIVTPENNIPMPNDTRAEVATDFRDKADIYFNTVKELSDAGMDIEITSEDKALSHKTLATEKFQTPSTIKAGTIANLNAILTQWDDEVLDVSRRLRNYVTNKLIVESTDEDPKIRLKSLELLGKVSTVGLFAERKDITITHRSVSDIETELMKTLELYAGRPKPTITLEAEFSEVREDDES